MIECGLFQHGRTACVAERGNRNDLTCRDGTVARFDRLCVGAGRAVGVGEWPESLGNHRARVRVEQPANAVWVHLPWRRRDTAPDHIEIIVIDAATNKRVDNVVRVDIQTRMR